jgi:phospholipase C
LLSPPKSSFKNNVLPAPLVGGPSQDGKPAQSYIPGNSLSLAQASENGLADYYQYLVGGGTARTRDPGHAHQGCELPAARPVSIDRRTFSYDDYAASPVHRFYQMWQQLDCSLSHITPEKSVGLRRSLFSWVEVTVGAGTNGLAPAANFSTEYSTTAKTTGEGSTSLGFYNVQKRRCALLQAARR